MLEALLYNITVLLYWANSCSNLRPCGLFIEYINIVKKNTKLEKKMIMEQLV